MNQKGIAHRQAVKDTADRALEIIQNEDSNIDSIVIAFITAMDSYKECVRNFFSTENGAGGKIKELYRLASDFSANTPKIDVIDLNYAGHIYGEYLIGMKYLIENKIGTIDSADPEVSTERFHELIEKDEFFIDSIFDGTNVRIGKDQPIENALGNLEVLIDFIPKMEESKEYLQKLKGSVEDSGSGNEKISASLFRLYALSNIRYSSKLLLKIFDTFQQIVDSMVKKPIISVNRPTSNPAPAVAPKYQLF